MKRILLIGLISSCASLSYSQTQVGNSGFETWENVASDQEPTNWNSFLTGGGTYAWAAANQIASSTTVRPGSSGTKSCRIWSRAVFGIIANGNVTLGKINMGSTTPTAASNYNATVRADANFSEPLTDRPDSIVFWAKFTPNGHTQNARMKATLHNNNDYRDPEDAASANYIVATAVVNYPSTAGAWKRFSVPFNYSGPASINTHILITFTTNQTPGGGAADDEVLVDDMELVYVPKATFTASGNSICAGSSINFTNTSTNFPTSYTWNFGDGTPTSNATSPTHTFATAGVFNVTLTATNQWGSTTSTAYVVNVTAISDATFSYAQATYCSNEVDPTPTVVDAGTFSSTAGLSINPSTGVIDLSASTPGTYTVTNTVSTSCPDTETTSITIDAASNSSFAYPSNTICAADGNKTPTTFDAGTFSATPAGLNFASTSTGEINVALSVPGTYTITHTVTGPCPSTTNVNLTITSNPDATFSYSQAEYCADAVDPEPEFGAGASGGVFSSTTGLIINSNSGIVDLSASTPGLYTVTNDIAAVGSCPSSTETFDITVNALPVVTLGAFSTVCVTASSFSLTGGAPAGGTYSGTGVTAGDFDPATAGVGTQTITYAYTDANSCSSSATSTIEVDACVGLEENGTNLISIFPNPTDGKLMITGVTTETPFSVISATGQVVIKGNVSKTADSIDLTSIENGIYIIQLVNEGSIQSIRVVKK